MTGTNYRFDFIEMSHPQGVQELSAFHKVGPFFLYLLD